MTNTASYPEHGKDDDGGYQTKDAAENVKARQRL